VANACIKRSSEGEARAVVGRRELELHLEDGAHFRGVSFGSGSATTGEVVFATGMVGYVESLTDPSYRGQILVLTYPLQGNYGVGRGVAPGFESSRVQVQGLVVSSATARPSHHGSERSLAQWLQDEGVPGVEGIDTRALTRHLRDHGTLRGWILPAGLEGEALERAKDETPSLDDRNLARLACRPETSFREAGPRKVLLVDSGVKDGIERQLLARGLSVLRVPFHGDLVGAATENAVDGIVLGNGPGDPKDLSDYVGQVARLLSMGRPVLGVCLGCQVMALAVGGDTYKLPYGHRSQNQPVRDLTTGRCFVTSQNHGYAVRSESLPPGWEPWFVNLNDGTNEGIRHASLPVRAAQFHPEASPGPEDTRFLFDDFEKAVDGARRSGGRT
jgi:carbamoyl-phosphate synthase small subunit